MAILFVLIALFASYAQFASINAEVTEVRESVETFIIEAKPVECQCKCEACPACPANHAPKHPAKSVLQHGETLYEKECLESPNRLYSACLDSDGQLIVKQTNGNPIWQSHTTGAKAGVPGPYKLTMQTDNNFCVGTDSKGIWCSFTHGGGTGQARAELRDDGNLVVIGTLHLWSTKTGLITLPNQRQLVAPACLTSLNGLYKACVQTDGNFVVYRGPPEPKSALWQTNTPENKGVAYFLIMQNDNNICTYRQAIAVGNNVWCAFSQGRGTGPAALIMQDDGNLVAYAGKAIWGRMNGLL